MIDASPTRVDNWIGTDQFASSTRSAHGQKIDTSTVTTSPALSLFGFDRFNDLPNDLFRIRRFFKPGLFVPLRVDTDFLTQKA